ncbi:hypothetical protein NC652_035911 [Populus alba x Populus x berolinensis]|nr:hypothetical protein NC652_035911 [Populus alba x Populus x berolinensis]
MGMIQDIWLQCWVWHLLWPAGESSRHLDVGLRSEPTSADVRLCDNPINPLLE